MSADLPDSRTGLIHQPDSVRWLDRMVWQTYSLGRGPESLAWGKRLLAMDDGHVLGLSVTGHVLAQQKMFPQAITLARRCLALAPDDERAWLCLGFALLSAPRTPANLGPALRAVSLRPGDRNALNNLGFALTNLKRFDEAKTWLRQALAAAPDHPALLLNLACVFSAEGNMETATAFCRRVLAARPDDVEALTNQGTYRLNQGCSREAIDLYRWAISLSPDKANAHHYAAMAYLRLGAFAIGWDLYEWRWRNEPSLNFPQLTRGRPCWDGSDLAGKTILLHGEQGLGDTLQFCRYVPLVARKAKVILAVLGPLCGLMATLGNDIQVLRLPTWLMLPFAPDWRWLEDRDDSPWYGSVRLFRQTRPGDWDGVIARIAEHLTSTFDLPLAS